MSPVWDVLLSLGQWAQDHAALVMGSSALVLLAMSLVRVVAWWQRIDRRRWR